jgi:small subunit ribosomal protein S1
MASADERDVDVSFPVEEDYEHLIEDYSHLAPPTEGELLQGHVVKVTPQEIIVDFGHKMEGLVPIEQVRQPDGTVPFRAGDSIDVMVDRHGPPPEGYVLLSHSKASRLRIWDTLERAMKDQLLVSGRVVERTKGGLIVDVGVAAFMPGSQVDVRPIHDLDQFTGTDIPVKVLKINRRRGNVVVSRKMAIEEELQARKHTALEHISEGAVVTGTIKNLTDYGAFVDLGGIDGLLHVSDMSHGRVNHPSEVVHVGQELSVKVLKFDRAKERISLGLRQMSPDPWETLPARCPQGSRVIGRVMSITDYGAFVEIEPGVEGLIHISEMTWSRK